MVIEKRTIEDHVGITTTLLKSFGSERGFKIHFDAITSSQRSSELINKVAKLFLLFFDGGFLIKFHIVNDHLVVSTMNDVDVFDRRISFILEPIKTFRNKIALVGIDIYFKIGFHNFRLRKKFILLQCFLILFLLIFLIIGLHKLIEYRGIIINIKSGE